MFWIKMGNDANFFLKSLRLEIPIRLINFNTKFCLLCSAVVMPRQKYTDQRNVSRTDILISVDHSFGFPRIALKCVSRS